MHKDQLSFELEKIRQSLQGTIWLLNHCNHSIDRTGYAHHVRDRISESLVDELNNVTETIVRLESSINDGINNDGSWDKIPF